MTSYSVANESKVSHFWFQFVLFFITFTFSVFVSNYEKFFMGLSSFVNLIFKIMLRPNIRLHAHFGSQVWTPLRGRTTSGQPFPGSIHTVHRLRETAFCGGIRQAQLVWSLVCILLENTYPPCFSSSLAALKQTPT